MATIQIHEDRMNAELVFLADRAVDAGGGGNRCPPGDMGAEPDAASKASSKAALWPADNTVETALFSIGELLGTGGFGRVHRAVHKDTGAEVAIKMLPASTDGISMAKEVELLRACSSDHIVQYHGAALHDKNGELWILMECCEGSILDVMAATKRCLTERQMSAVLAAVLDGLLFLHRRHIMHRDLKAANVLLTRQGAIKLADFGVATRMTSSISARHTLVGTAPWLAPEVVVGTSALLALQAGLPPGVGYGKKADVWSLGITVLEMGEGNAPLSGATPHAALFFIPVHPAPTFEKPELWSPGLRSFLARALVKLPSDRASVNELLLEPFIAEFGRSNQQNGELQRLAYAALPELAGARREAEQRRRERLAYAAQRRDDALREQQRRAEQAAAERAEEEARTAAAAQAAATDSNAGAPDTATASLDSHARMQISHFAQQLLRNDLGDESTLSSTAATAGGSAGGSAPDTTLVGSSSAGPSEFVIVEMDGGPSAQAAREGHAAVVGAAVTPAWAEISTSLVAAAPAVTSAAAAAPAVVDGENGATVSLLDPEAVAPARGVVQIVAPGPERATDGSATDSRETAAGDEPPGLVSQGTLVVHESRAEAKMPTFLRALLSRVRSSGGTGGGGTVARHERRGNGGGGSTSSTGTGSTGVRTAAAGGRGRNTRSHGRHPSARSAEAIAAERAALERERLRELERIQRKFSKREEELQREAAARGELYADAGDS